MLLFVVTATATAAGTRARGEAEDPVPFLWVASHGFAPRMLSVHALVKLCVRGVGDTTRHGCRGNAQLHGGDKAFGPVHAGIPNRVSFDPYAPYGPLVESSVRVVTWNVCGRFGSQWEARQLALEDTLAEVAPDVVCLIEAWHHSESDQPERLAARLGMPYHHLRVTGSMRTGRRESAWSAAGR